MTLRFVPLSACRFSLSFPRHFHIDALITIYMEIFLSHWQSDFWWIYYAQVKCKHSINIYDHSGVSIPLAIARSLHHFIIFLLENGEEWRGTERNVLIKIISTKMNAVAPEQQIENIQHNYIRHLLWYGTSILPRPSSTGLARKIHKCSIIKLIHGILSQNCKD